MPGSLNPGSIILMVLSIFIIAALVPSAITEFTDVDTSTWPDTVATLWDLGPIAIVIGIVVGLLAFAGIRVIGGRSR